MRVSATDESLAFGAATCACALADASSAVVAKSPAAPVRNTDTIHLPQLTRSRWLGAVSSDLTIGAYKPPATPPPTPMRRPWGAAPRRPRGSACPLPTGPASPRPPPCATPHWLPARRHVARRSDPPSLLFK